MVKLIRVKGNYNGITLESGKMLFSDIAKAMLDGENVKVDFVNQEYITPVFLCASIGYLFALLKEDAVHNKVEVIGVENKDEDMLNKIWFNGSQYWTEGETSETNDVAIAKMAERIRGS